MRYLDVGVIALTVVCGLGWYVLWALDVRRRVRRWLAVVAVVAFIATVVVYQIMVAFPPEGAAITGRP